MSTDFSTVDSDLTQVETDSAADVAAVQTAATAIAQLQSDMTALEAIITAQGDGGASAALAALTAAATAIQQAQAALGQTASVPTASVPAS